MKKTTTNTIEMDVFMQIHDLLEKGTSLNDTLILISSYQKSQSIQELMLYLNNGYTIIDALSNFKVDTLFYEMLCVLYPMKGLSNAINDAIVFVEEKKKWISFIKKQLTYPIILILIMVIFSLFANAFLLPEMQKLFVTMNAQQHNSHFLLTVLNVIPTMLILLIVLLFIMFGLIVISIQTQNRKWHERLKKIPFISNVIHTYYSLKFTFYFSKISHFFDSFSDLLKYLEKNFSNTDLKLLISALIHEINEGHTLSNIVGAFPYFTKPLKQYFKFILESQQSLSLLENYCFLTYQYIFKKMQLFSNLILLVIYSFTGIYIICLYSFMLVPILEITSFL